MRFEDVMSLALGSRLSMKTPAAARLARMAMNASTMTYFMRHDYRMSKRFVGNSFWWVTLATLLGVLVTASLGQWQLGRAAQKEAQAQLMRDREQQSVLDWPDVLHAIDRQQEGGLLQRRVNLEGRWGEGKVLFLDNRPLNGKSGYWVLSPFVPVNSQGAAILVVRAWAPRQSDQRNTVPSIPAESGVVRLEGRLSAPPSKLYELGVESSGPVRQNADVQSLAQEWALPLLSVAVRQTGDTGLPDGWSRGWSVPNVDVHKHYGYALQWFGLSALMVILYVWFQFLVPFRHARAASRDHA